MTLHMLDQVVYRGGFVKNPPAEVVEALGFPVDNLEAIPVVLRVLTGADGQERRELLRPVPGLEPIPWGWGWCGPATAALSAALSYDVFRDLHKAERAAAGVQRGLVRYLVWPQPWSATAREVSLARVVPIEHPPRFEALGLRRMPQGA